MTYNADLRAIFGPGAGSLTEVRVRLQPVPYTGGMPQTRESRPCLWENLLFGLGHGQTQSACTHRVTGDTSPSNLNLTPIPGPRNRPRSPPHWHWRSRFRSSFRNLHAPQCHSRTLDKPCTTRTCTGPPQAHQPTSRNFAHALCIGRGPRHGVPPACDQPTETLRVTVSLTRGGHRNFFQPKKRFDFYPKTIVPLHLSSRHERVGRI